MVTKACQWSEWHNGECSVSCGRGTITKTRTKSIQEKNGGNCEGDTTETINCNQPKCPRKLL